MIVGNLILWSTNKCAQILRRTSAEHIFQRPELDFVHFHTAQQCFGGCRRACARAERRIGRADAMSEVGDIARLCESIAQHLHGAAHADAY